MEKEVYVGGLNLCEFGKNVMNVQVAELKKFVKYHADVSVVVEKEDGEMPTLVLEDVVPMGKAKAVSGMVQAWCALKGVEADMYYKPEEEK